MLKKLLPLFAGLLLTFVAYAASEVELRDDHPDTYIVQRGDTLWDISAKFLKKPWLWPEVWQANPQVQNPHLIYPGDVINLAYLNGRAQLTHGPTGNGPRVRATSLEDAIPPIPLSVLKSFLTNTRLIDEATLRHAPHVVAIEENQLRGTHGNLVYVKGLDAREGARFAIVRPTTIYYSMPPEKDGQPRSVRARPIEDIFHGQSGQLWHWGPDHYTLAGNVEVGYEVLVTGQAQVTRSAEVSSVLVTYSDYEVRQGDLLLPVEDKPYDSQFVPHAPAAVPPEMRVIAFTDAMNAAGPLQVIALSRGGKDGVENGQTYSIYHPGEKATDNYKYKRGGFKALFNPKDKQVQLPEEFVGHVMIFRTFDQVSYGLVMNGIRPAHIGDTLRAPE